MELRLGSQDVPLALNTVPNVYATNQGGGAGDARINVRGFNQRNVAIMLNGIPERYGETDRSIGQTGMELRMLHHQFSCKKV